MARRIIICILICLSAFQLHPKLMIVNTGSGFCFLSQKINRQNLRITYLDMNIFESKYKEITVQTSIVAFIEQIIGRLENIGWDPDYGGYYLLADDLRKDLQIQVVALDAFATLYEITKNNTYLKKVYVLMNTIDKFKSPEDNLFHCLWNRDFSSYEEPDGGFDEFGSFTLYGGLLRYCEVLVNIYYATRNNTFLGNLISIWNYVFNTFRDPTYGGLTALTGSRQAKKHPGHQALYAYISMHLFNITKNVTYKNIATECMNALENMWNDGFFRIYDTDFGVYQNIRGYPDLVLFDPLKAYAMATYIFQNSTYEARRDTLLNQMFQAFWDDTYYGWYRDLNSDFSIYSSDKVPYCHAVGIDAFLICKYVLNMNLSSDLGNKIQLVVNRLIQLLNDSPVLYHYYTCDWSPRTEYDKNFGQSFKAIASITKLLISNDTDADGLPNFLENECGTNPNDPDTDDDGLPDGWEYYHDLDPLNSSDAGLDFDGDGLTNIDEYQLNTDPQNVDSDSDGMPDGWEIQYNFDPLNTSDAGLDADDDGLSNVGEYESNTDPLDNDSDDDGIPDGWEVTHGLDPLDSSDASGDSDGDGLTNLEEYELNTDPQNVDSDSDGIPDSWEIQYNLDPTDSSDASLDPDGDGLSNLREYELGTDPHNSDSDGDGFSDGLEVLLGTDPLSSGDSPLFTRILPPVMIIVFVVIVKIIIVVRRRALISFVREWSRKRYEL